MNDAITSKIDDLIEAASAAGIEPNQVMHRFRHAHMRKRAMKEFAKDIPAPAIPPGLLPKLIEYLDDEAPVPNLEGVFRLVTAAIKGQDGRGIGKGLAALYRAVKTQNRNWLEAE